MKFSALYLYSFWKYTMTKHELIKMNLAEKLKNMPCLKNINYTKPLIQLGKSQTSVWHWVKIIKEQGNIGSGPAFRLSIKDTIKEFTKLFKHKSRCSQRSSARGLGCSQAYVSKILKKYINIKCHKMLKRPLLTPQQRAVAKPNSKHIYYNYRNKEFHRWRIALYAEQCQTARQRPILFGWYREDMWLCEV